MIIRSAAAASITSGIMTIQNITGNSWVASYSGKQSSTASSYGGGDKTLSDTLTQVRITTVNGTDTFDAGTVNIMYE
jgi:expansin (peptidoglycan-binding protein)